MIDVNKQVYIGVLTAIKVNMQDRVNFATRQVIQNAWWNDHPQERVYEEIYLVVNQDVWF